MDKPTVARLLAAYDLAGIEALAREHRRVLSLLLRFTFDPDPRTAWRAVDALGRAAAVVADRDPEFVRNILRRLIWSLNDESGSIGWMSPQSMGAIVAGRLDLFPEFVPIILSQFEIDEETFRPGTLWAMGVIGNRRPDLVQAGLLDLLRMLGSPDPQARGHACWAAGQAAFSEALPRLNELVHDEATFTFYQAGELLAFTVGQMAQEAAARLKGMPGTR